MKPSNIIKTVNEYIPFTIKASEKQRDKIVVKWLYELKDEFLKSKKKTTIYELQAFVNKKYPNKNIDVVHQPPYFDADACIIPKFSPKTHKLNKIELRLNFNKKGKINLYTYNKVIIIHEFSHIFDWILKPKIALHRANLSRIERVNIKETEEKSELIYSSRIYIKESFHDFSKRGFEKQLIESIAQQKLDKNNSVKIACLKEWSNHIKSEMNAYRNGIKIGLDNDRALMPDIKIINIKKTFSDYKFKQKISVINKMLLESINEERKLHHQKIKKSNK